MIINPYRFTVAGGGNGLLDQYTGAAAAFSLRELSDAWAGQAVVNVYRVSDAATSDFTSDEITDGTMSTWLGTTGGLIEKWYDQSGNGFDAIPASMGTNKPRIYTGSTQTVTTVNGEPAIDMTLYGMKNASTIAYNGGVSWYGVLDCGVVSGSNRVWGDDITGAQGYTTFTTNGTSRLNDNDTGYEDVFASSHSTVQELSSFHFDSSTGDYEYARDGSNTTGNLATWSDVAIDSSNTANFGLGDAGNGGQPLAGFIQELIIYPDDQSANRTGIEGDINDHYLIY